MGSNLNRVLSIGSPGEGEEFSQIKGMICERVDKVSVFGRGSLPGGAGAQLVDD